MHQYTTEDTNGDLIDAVALCSDACNRQYAGENYRGWNGCIETEFTTYCANCGVVIPGQDACGCQIGNVVVNRFLSETGERCGHGCWIQLPHSMLETNH